MPSCNWQGKRNLLMVMWSLTKLKAYRNIKMSCQMVLYYCNMVHFVRCLHWWESFSNDWTYDTFRLVHSFLFLCGSWNLKYDPWIFPQPFQICSFMDCCPTLLQVVVWFYFIIFSSNYNFNIISTFKAVLCYVCPFHHGWFEFLKQFLRICTIPFLLNHYFIFPGYSNHASCKTYLISLHVQ
jgi:hypothetical protein